MFLIQHKIGAIFQLTARKASTGEITKQSGKFQNIVLTSGLKMMGEYGGNWGSQCFVGTGSSVPNVTQTSLDSPIAMTNQQLSNADVSNRLTRPYYAGITITFRFNAGAAAGNLTEVCIGQRTGNGGSTPFTWRAWNRALIKDANGDPTTMTILEDEFLDVSVEIRMYPTEKITGSFRFLDKLGAVKSTHTYEGYPYVGGAQNSTTRWHLTDLGVYKNTVNNADFKDITKTMTGQRVAYVSAPANTEISDGDTRLISPAVFGLAAANDTYNGVFIQYGGVLGISGLSGYKMIFDPPLTKTNQEEHTWRAFIEWGQYEGTM